MKKLKKISDKKIVLKIYKKKNDNCEEYNDDTVMDEF